MMFFAVTFFDVRGNPVNQAHPGSRGKHLVHSFKDKGFAQEYALNHLSGHVKTVEVRETSRVQGVQPGEGHLVWRFERGETKFERWERERRNR